MGLAIKDKYYGDGYTYLGTHGIYNLVKTGVKFDDSSKSFKDNYTGIDNLYSLVESGIYYTDLSYLLGTKGFAKFLHADGGNVSVSNAFGDVYDDKVPVIIYVDLDKDSMKNKVEVNRGQEIGYLAKMANAGFGGHDSYFPGKEAVYKTLAGVTIPEIPGLVLRDITYACTYPDDYIVETDINSLDLSSNKVAYLLYKGIPVSFYKLEGSIDMYVGGYGFRLSYPDGYVAMTVKDKPSAVIDIYAYEQPKLYNMNNKKPADLAGHVRNKLGYLFDIFGTKFADGSTYALGFPKADDDIDYSSEYPTTVDNFDLPYNPNIYTAIGKMPFTNKILLCNTVDLDNIGYVGENIRINDIGISTYKYLPHGLYKINPYDWKTFLHKPSGTDSNYIYYLEDGFVYGFSKGFHYQKIVCEVNVTSPANNNCYTRFNDNLTNKSYSNWLGHNI